MSETRRGRSTSLEAHAEDRHRAGTPPEVVAATQANIASPFHSNAHSRPRDFVVRRGSGWHEFLFVLWTSRCGVGIALCARLPVRRRRPDEAGSSGLSGFGDSTGDEPNVRPGSATQPAGRGNAHSQRRVQRRRGLHRRAERALLHGERAHLRPAPAVFVRRLSQRSRLCGRPRLLLPDARPARPGLRRASVRPGQLRDQRGLWRHLLHLQPRLLLVPSEDGLLLPDAPRRLRHRCRLRVRRRHRSVRRVLRLQCHGRALGVHSRLLPALSGAPGSSGVTCPRPSHSGKPATCRSGSASSSSP